MNLLVDAPEVANHREELTTSGKCEIQAGFIFFYYVIRRLKTFVRRENKT